MTAADLGSFVPRAYLGSGPPWSRRPLARVRTACSIEEGRPLGRHGRPLGQGPWSPSGALWSLPSGSLA